jgi:hypothetical protein
MYVTMVPNVWKLIFDPFGMVMLRRDRARRHAGTAEELQRVGERP